MATTYEARLNGYECSAQRIKGRWMVGGDFLSKGASALVKLPYKKTDRMAWFEIRGNRAVFQDFAAKPQVSILDV